MVDWTIERVAALSTDQLKSLRDNALRRKEGKIVEFCEAEIMRRTPTRNRSPRVRALEKSHDDQVVAGFHFVCPREKGVTKNTDGTVWTGTWVVDKHHAKQALEIGAYVALHTEKSEQSYLQGVVRDWRSAKRAPEYAEGRPAAIEYGVDFLIEPTTIPYTWNGDGAGEKGYVWKDAQFGAREINKA